jgi:hypothetical protein
MDDDRAGNPAAAADTTRAAAVDALPPGMPYAAGVVHDVRWSEALPWWLLFRAAGAAFAPTVILLATLGCLATWAGWSLADRLQVAGVDRTADLVAAAGDGLVLPSGAAAAPATTGWPLAAPPSRQAVSWLTGLCDRLPVAVAELLLLAAIPFRPLASGPQVVGAVARLTWFVLVWSIFGTAIARYVALKLVGEDTTGLFGSIWYGTQKWLSSFNAVAFVILGIIALAVPGALLGLVMRTDVGLAVAGAVWPLVLAGAVVLAILAVGVVAGWPLMVSAVGVERGDSFQAISTAFSYLYQRPLHYAFYGLVAAVVALPALAAAGVFADATASFAIWAASFGMGHDRTAAVLRDVAAGGGDVPWGSRAIGFWMRSLEAVLASFGWGYFWSIATAAYLLLRRDVDGTECDEVVLDEPAGG